MSGNRRQEWLDRRRRLESRLEQSRERSTPGGARGLSLLYDRATAIERSFRAVGLYARGMRNAGRPHLHRIELFPPGLPAAFDGFTILFVSDLHLDVSAGVLVPAGHLAAGVECDIAVFGGDYQSYGRPAAAAAAAAMAPLVAAIRARQGMFAILGNHDRHDMVSSLEGLGLTVLVNECAVLERDGERLTLVGCDDVHAFHHPDAVRVLREESGFRVALVHSPDLAMEAEAAGCALYLAGHTHGGQICLPGGRPIITGLEGGRALARGVWQLRGMPGYTSTGLGCGLVPVRFNCPPEVALITLRRRTP